MESSEVVVTFKMVWWVRALIRALSCVSVVLMMVYHRVKFGRRFLFWLTDKMFDFGVWIAKKGSYCA